MAEKIKYGFGVRQFGKTPRTFEQEVEFAKINGFDFLQVFYFSKKGLEMIPPGKGIERIRKANFPVIIHAGFEPREFQKQIPKVVNIIDELGGGEVIIHPWNPTGRPESSFSVLIQEMAVARDIFEDKGIKVYVENNSEKDSILIEPEEIKEFFGQFPEMELLLDIGHMVSFEKTKAIAKVKLPALLHMSDRDLNGPPNHLPIGKGNIDFKRVIGEILPDFQGKIILEVTESDEAIINSKKIIEYMLSNNY
ncbi:MAG: TIM barrel protein [Patescibacteria group bacterium]